MSSIRDGPQSGRKRMTQILLFTDVRNLPTNSFIDLLVAHKVTKSAPSRYPTSNTWSLGL